MQIVICPDNSLVYAVVDISPNLNNTEHDLYSIPITGVTPTRLKPDSFVGKTLFIDISPKDSHLIIRTCLNGCSSFGEHRGYSISIDCQPELNSAVPVPAMGSWALIFLALILFSLGAAAGKNFEAKRQSVT